MIVYNTTFHIHKEVLADCLGYLRTQYIPRAVEGGMLSNPYLRRVLSSENEEGESYCVQFHVEDVETLNDWSQKVGRSLQSDLVNRFREKVAGFSTLLEEIEL